MIRTEFKCEGCGVHVTTVRFWNYRTIPPSMDARDLCRKCKEETMTLEKAQCPKCGLLVYAPLSTHECNIKLEETMSEKPIDNSLTGGFEAWNEGVAISQQVERVARAICIADNVDPDLEVCGMGVQLPVGQIARAWQARIRQAEAAIAAYHPPQVGKPLRGEIY